MAQHTDIKTARIAAEAAIRTSPSAANHAQLARLEELEVAVAELKVKAARINAAGGVTDSNAATALANYIANL